MILQKLKTKFKQIERLESKEWKLMRNFHNLLNKYLDSFKKIFPLPKSEDESDDESDDILSCLEEFPNQKKCEKDGAEKVWIKLKKTYDAFIDSLYNRLQESFNGKDEGAIEGILGDLLNEKKSFLFNPNKLTTLNWTYLMHLFNVYKNMKDLPPAECPEGFRSERINVVVGNLVVQITSNQGKKEIKAPIHHGLKNVLVYNELEELERKYIEEQARESLKNVVKQAKESIKPLISDLSLELKHSEKPFLGSVLSMIKTLIKQVIQEIKQIEKAGLKVISIDDIAIELFSTRECCAFCESFLSNSFERIIKEAIKDLGQSLTGIDISKCLVLRKYFAYTFNDITDFCLRNLVGKEEYKFYIDRRHKSFFNYEFLDEVLQNSHECFEAKRSYYLNSTFSMNQAKNAIRTRASQKNQGKRVMTIVSNCIPVT